MPEESSKSDRSPSPSKSPFPTRVVTCECSQKIKFVQKTKTPVLQCPKCKNRITVREFQDFEPPEANEQKSANTKSGSEPVDYVKTKCPHCMASNKIKKSSQDKVLKCTGCGKKFRIRRSTGSQKISLVPLHPKVEIRCPCKAMMTITYADFGKRVKCPKCQKLVQVPSWVAETRFSEEEFDEIFSEDEWKEIQNAML